MKNIEKLLGRKLSKTEKMLYEMQKNEIGYYFDKDKNGNLISLKK
jgi:hypothetical protein